MRGWLTGLAALMLLCGCSANAREPDRLALVRVLGVDGASPVTLTAVCGAAGGQEPIRGSCVDETVLLARENLPWVGEEELALTSVSWLIIGGNADLRAVLFTVLEDQQLGPSARVWLAPEGAGALLEDCQDPAARLELLELRGQKGVPTAKALGALITEGSVLLPVLEVQEGELVCVGEERWYEQ